MIQEFQQVLRTPSKQSSAQILTQTQNLILSTFEDLFPSNFDLSALHEIYAEVLGEGVFPSQEQVEITQNQQIILNHKLLEYFVSMMKNNFVILDSYQALEEQTQKAESIIRSHIKIEQQMKMYLEYLQAKIEKIQRQVDRKPPKSDLKRQMQILERREQVLMKEKINLIKDNEKLKFEIKVLKENRENFGNQGIFLHPQDHARKVTSKLASNLETPVSSENETKEKEKLIIEKDINWQQNITQKKKSSYFN